MSKTPRKAAPKRPAPSPEPTFATLGTTLGDASVPGALGGAMDAALGFAASGPATLAAVPDHPAIRQPPAPPPVPFCRQVTIIRAQGGFTLFATEPGDGSFECDPADAIAVASTPTDLLARVQEWAGKSEPPRDGCDIPI
jgi:hypothetical protein